MLLVLDTSVIAKWFVEENNSDIALQIRKEFHENLHEISIPDLLLYELSNALRYSNFTPDVITKAIDSLLDMNLSIVVPSRNLISEATKLAYKFNITIYDAIYLALSNESNGIFVTADDKLYKKVEKNRNCKLLSKFYE